MRVWFLATLTPGNDEFFIQFFTFYLISTKENAFV